jgi:hypothetical protein
VNEHTEAPPPDPDKGIFIFCSGKKGSGKSVVCRHWFDAYPYDRVVVDATHDLKADFDREGIQYTELRGGLDLPARLPAPDPRNPRTWIFCPDMGDPAAFDDMDRVVGLALGRGPTLLWLDEFGEQSTGNKSGPNVRRLLHHGRHDGITLLLACPRPQDINPLGISQADIVYTFATNNPADRKRVAENIGIAPAEFDEVNNVVKQQGQHWHSRYDNRVDDLVIMPPLPRPRRGVNARAPIGEPLDLGAAAELDQHDRGKRSAAQFDEHRVRDHNNRARAAARRGGRANDGRRRR